MAKKTHLLAHPSSTQCDFSSPSTLSPFQKNSIVESSVIVEKIASAYQNRCFPSNADWTAREEPLEPFFQTSNVTRIDNKFVQLEK